MPKKRPLKSKTSCRGLALRGDACGHGLIRPPPGVSHDVYPRADMGPVRSYGGYSRTRPAAEPAQWGRDGFDGRTASGRSASPRWGDGYVTRANSAPAHVELLSLWTEWAVIRGHSTRRQHAKVRVTTTKGSRVYGFQSRGKAWDRGDFSPMSHRGDLDNESPTTMAAIIAAVTQGRPSTTQPEQPLPSPARHIRDDAYGLFGPPRQHSLKFNGRSALATKRNDAGPRVAILDETAPSSCERILRVEVRDPQSVRPVRVYDVATDARYTVIGGKHVRGCIGLVPGFNEERREIQDQIRGVLAQRAGEYAYQQPAPAPIPMPAQHGDAPWVQEGLFGGPPPPAPARRTKKNRPPISPATVGEALREGGFRPWRTHARSGFATMYAKGADGRPSNHAVYVWSPVSPSEGKVTMTAIAAYLRRLGLVARLVEGKRAVLVEG